MEEEYGALFSDESEVLLVLASNNGKDNGKHLEFAKNMKRPFLLSIEANIFETYKFRNYALSISEAKMLIKELTRMIDYIEN